MKQSEYKNKLKKELSEYSALYEEYKNRPIKVDEIVCENKDFKNHLGGHDNRWRQQICWHCPNCGRVGCDYIPSTLLEGDKINYINCDLQEG